MYLVSIIIPTYESNATLPETLESVVNQEFKDFEVILADDGSSEPPDHIVEDFGARMPIRLLRGQHTGFPGAPRNQAAVESTSKYLYFLDSDDLLRANALRDAVEVTESDERASLVFSNFRRFMDRSGETIVPDWLGQDHIARVLRSVPTDTVSHVAKVFCRPVYDELLQHNFISTSGLLIDAHTFQSAGGFDESLHGAEDRDLWLRLCEMGSTFAYLTEVSVEVRVRKLSASRSPRVFASQISLYESILERGMATEPSKRMIRQRLGDLYFSNGRYLQEMGSSKEARRSFRKSIQFGNLKRRIYALDQIIKLPIKALVRILGRAAKS